MAKYTVNVTETSRGFIEVEANSREEALSLAEAEYWNGNVFWNHTEEEYEIERSEEE